MNSSIIFRDHPEFRRKPSVENEVIASNIEPSVSNEVMHVDFSNFGIDEHENTDIPFDVNLVDVVKCKNDIFQTLFANIMKSKIVHCIPNEGVDEIMSALLEASQKSNLVYKKFLKQAIDSQKSALSNGM